MNEPPRWPVRHLCKPSPPVQSSDVDALSFRYVLSSSPTHFERSYSFSRAALSSLRSAGHSFSKRLDVIRRNGSLERLAGETTRSKTFRDSCGGSDLESGCLRLEHSSFISSGEVGARTESPDMNRETAGFLESAVRVRPPLPTRSSSVSRIQAAKEAVPSEPPIPTRTRMRDQAADAMSCAIASQDKEFKLPARWERDPQRLDASTKFSEGDPVLSVCSQQPVKKDAPALSVLVTEPRFDRYRRRVSSLTSLAFNKSASEEKRKDHRRSHQSPTSVSALLSGRRRERNVPLSFDPRVSVAEQPVTDGERAQDCRALPTSTATAARLLSSRRSLGQSSKQQSSDPEQCGSKNDVMFSGSSKRALCSVASSPKRARDSPPPSSPALTGLSVSPTSLSLESDTVSPFSFSDHTPRSAAGSRVHHNSSTLAAGEPAEDEVKIPQAGGSCASRPPSLTHNRSLPFADALKTANLPPPSGPGYLTQVSRPQYSQSAAPLGAIALGTSPCVNTTDAALREDASIEPGRDATVDLGSEDHDWADEFCEYGYYSHPWELMSAPNDDHDTSSPPSVAAVPFPRYPAHFVRESVTGSKMEKYKLDAENCGLPAPDKKPTRFSNRQRAPSPAASPQTDSTAGSERKGTGEEVDPEDRLRERSIENLSFSPPPEGSPPKPRRENASRWFGVTPRDFVCCRRKIRCCDCFRQLFKKDNLRWTLQAMVAAALTSLLTIIEPVNRKFNSTGYWAVVSALVVIESTTGGSVKKSAERIVGTCLGGLGAWALFAAVSHNSGPPYKNYVKYCLWLIAGLWPLPWGIVRARFPNNPLISVYGTFTGHIILLSGYTRGGAFSLAVYRIAAVVIGVMVTCIVVHVILPNPARYKLSQGMSEILSSLAEILEPLVELESGLQPEKAVNAYKPRKAFFFSLVKKQQELRRAAKAKRAAEMGRLPEMEQQAQQSRKGSDAPETPKLTPATFDPSALSLDQEKKTGQTRRFSFNIQALTSTVSLGLLRKENTASNYEKERGRDSVSTAIELTTPNPRKSEDLSFTDTSKESDDFGMRLPELPERSGRRLSASYMRYLETPSTAAAAAGGAGSGTVSGGTEFMASLSRLLTQVDTKTAGSRAPSRRPTATTWAVQSFCEHCAGVSRSLSAVSEKWDAEARQLEARKMQELAQTTADLRKLLEAEEARRKERWCQIMTKIQRCHSLLAAQAALLVAARQEISCTHQTFFPYRRWRDALGQVRQLFYHVASLFFSLDLQVSQHHRQQYRNLSLAQIVLQPKTQSIVNMTAIGIEGGGGAKALSPDDPSTQRQLFAGLLVASQWSDVYGPLIGRVARYIKDALKDMCRSVELERRSFETRVLVEQASDEIERLHVMRKKRRLKFARVIQRAIDAEIGVVDPTRSKESDSLLWEDVMGVDAAAFREMSKAEHEAYWEAYWVGGDRLSVTENTLIVLRDHMRKCCHVVDDIVDGSLRLRAYDEDD